jgi:hypothetical protein
MCSLLFSGEQSKTLMLVHVSPKEMDIKETVCSLSFASRARGTHIGHEISQVWLYSVGGHYMSPMHKPFLKWCHTVNSQF